MILSEWLPRQLGDVTTWRSGGTPPMSNKSFWTGDIPWISASTMYSNVFYTSTKFISAEGLKAGSKLAKPNDLLLLVRGSMLWNRIPIGIAKTDLAFNQDVKSISASSNLLPNFLLFWFLANENKLLHMVTGTGIGAGKLDTKELLGMEIEVPPLPEQKKIAQILSTWDKAIETVEKLIANSQQKKKALMQQLLTGKKRLAGFSDDDFSVHKGFAKSKLGGVPESWKVEPIKDYFWYQEGPGVRKYQFTETGVKLFNGTNIQNSQINLFNTKTCISEEEAYGSYAHFLADSDDLVIACSGISVDRFDEKIAFLGASHLPLCMNTSTMRFKPLNNEIADIKYFKYFMMSPLFKNQIRRQITGSAQLNFGPSHVGKCYVVLPHIEEQKKIASALSSADQEIETWQQELEHLKQEKKALMQQLLTGKRRVVI